MSTSSALYIQWQPILDKYRYRPLGVHPVFFQNGFEIIFLVALVWFWNWSAFLLLLFYVIESVILWLFTAWKLWTSNARGENSDARSTRTVKVKTITTLSVIVLLFSIVQVLVARGFMASVINLPTFKELLLDDQFLIGVGAINLQQIVEHLKYQRQSGNEAFDFAVHTLTPLVRIFVQQVSVIVGVILLTLIAPYHVKLAALMVALVLGLVKLVTGQVQLVAVRKNKRLR